VFRSAQGRSGGEAAQYHGRAQRCKGFAAESAKSLPFRSFRIRRLTLRLPQFTKPDGLSWLSAAAFLRLSDRLIFQPA
jgi:hypothetical protein